MKKCNYCGKIKHWNKDFYTKFKSFNYLLKKSQCNDCVNALRLVKRHGIYNKDLSKEYIIEFYEKSKIQSRITLHKIVKNKIKKRIRVKKCYSCNEWLDKEMHYVKHHTCCINCRKEYMANYMKTDKFKEYIRNYTTSEKYKNYIKNYNKKKYSNDNLFRLSVNTRDLIRKYLKNKGYTKKSRTHEILGCDFETFKAHLERQFTKGMNWDNYGEWHLDHIYPVSLAKDEQHLLELNHYTNFRPMWGIDNIKKGNKIVEHQIKLPI